MEALVYFEIFRELGGIAPSSRLFGSRGSSGDWRWRLKGANHKIIAQGEGYANRVDCQDAVDLLKGTAASTPVRYV